LKPLEKTRQKNEHRAFRGKWKRGDHKGVRKRKI